MRERLYSLIDKGYDTEELSKIFKISKKEISIIKS